MVPYSVFVRGSGIRQIPPVFEDAFLVRCTVGPSPGAVFTRRSTTAVEAEPIWKRGSTRACVGACCCLLTCPMTVCVVCMLLHDSSSCLDYRLTVCLRGISRALHCFPVVVLGVDTRRRAASGPARPSLSVVSLPQQVRRCHCTIGGPNHCPGRARTAGTRGRPGGARVRSTVAQAVTCRRCARSSSWSAPLPSPHLRALTPLLSLSSHWRTRVGVARSDNAACR